MHTGPGTMQCPPSVSLLVTAIFVLTVVGAVAVKDAHAGSESRGGWCIMHDDPQTGDFHQVCGKKGWLTLYLRRFCLSHTVYQMCCG